MSDKKSGRQSNLLAFFQKTPKNEPSSELEVVERENLHLGTPQNKHASPHQHKSSSTTPKRTAQKPQSSTKRATPLGRHQPQLTSSIGSGTSAFTEPVMLGAEDDDDSRGVGYMSCSSSFTPSSVEAVPPPKRRRVILSSDDEEEPKDDVQEPEGNTDSSEHPVKKMREESSCDPINQPSKNGESESRKKLVRTFVKSSDSKPSTTSSATVGAFAQSFIDSFNADSEQTCCSSVSPTNVKLKEASVEDRTGCTTASDDVRFPHLKFEFLLPDKIKDAKGRCPNHPEYDKRTLYVPEQFLKSQTPGHRQWWKLKSEHFDTLLFFKVGKFYELFHMDAVVAVENLGLTYMRSKIAHCGFPEIGYGRFADQLVNRGFKVARVEQTETPQQLTERQNKTMTMSQEKEKVVRREICRITTQATKTYGVQDGTDSRELDGTTDPNPNYLMAIVEKHSASCSSLNYGVCFVDCSIGMFKLSEFADDANLSNLRTLLAHNYPAQLLYEKGGLSSSTLTLLDTMLSTVPKEALFPKKQFRTAEATLALLRDDNYLGADLAMWPDTVRQMFSSADLAIPEPSESFKLCLSALGATLWYLKHCLIDVDMVSMRQFSHYIPPSIVGPSSKGKETSNENFWRGRYMILDGVSLLNLHIVPSFSNCGLSSTSRSSVFSLYNTINRCQTAFGKRLLRQWVSAPTCDRKMLLDRQRSIQWLCGEEMVSHTTKMTELLRKMPDLERFFQRIHTIGLKYRADPLKGHPDSRAQFFDNDKYNKRKIRDLLIVLDGLGDVEKLMQLFEKISASAQMKLPSLLVECLSRNYKDMSEDLSFFKNAFDRANALENGVILPRKGVDAEYDAARQEEEECKASLDSYLHGIGKKLKCSAKFVGTGRNAYQLELPESACNSLGDNFQLTSQRKGFKRYTTNNLQKLVDTLNEAESQCAAISAEVTRRVFAELDARKNKWSTVIHQIATFDCLMALASYAQSSTQKMCFPEFVFDSEKPFINIQLGYHPSLVETKSSLAVDFNYIPNSCILGTLQKPAHTMLLTGPNMGGKSTYMRQVASLVVLAQIGSMVPADSMNLTPVDRIFCRVGASDRLSAGQSTFFVELAETNTILRQATQHSLVLIDELGRGTSTFDGTAIACAVLKHISRKIRCRTLFSTHYHSLCTFVANEPDIGFAHMACMVENANLDDPTMEAITFLYTLADGMCDKSYGFYTAKMAGLNVEIVRRAFQASISLNDQHAL